MSRADKVGFSPDPVRSERLSAAQSLQERIAPEEGGQKDHDDRRDIDDRPTLAEETVHQGDRTAAQDYGNRCDDSYGIVTELTATGAIFGHDDHSFSCVVHIAYQGGHALIIILLFYKKVNLCLCIDNKKSPAIR